MSDWETKPIAKVFAGHNCIMAVTQTGETLQKIQKPEFACKTPYWTRIQQIALSHWVEGAAIGLVEDGTCLIAKKPIRNCCKIFCLDFDHINETVKSWTDVVQVAASDAFFALRSDGTVQYVSFSQRCQSEYEPIKAWKDVVSIQTGTQNSVFGITRNGTVLAAGGNTAHLQEKLHRYEHVADLYPTGSECEDVYLLKADGAVENLHSDCLSSVLHAKAKKLEGHFAYHVFALTEDKQIYKLTSPNKGSVFPEERPIVSFAVGDWNYSDPFVIALAESL